MTEHWRKWHISEMSDEECIKALMPPRIEFWVYNHFPLLWRVLRWNWFNIWTGERGFWLFARHCFKEWK